MVVIMGIVYTFAIGSLEKVRQKSENLLPTAKNLKAFLLAQDFEKEARLVCFDDCSHCSVLLDGKETKTTQTLFDSSVKLYRYSPTMGMEQTQSDPYFDENGVQRDVCFSYRIYKDGIGDQILVEYKNRVYDYSEYLEDVKTYDSIDAAQQHKEAMLHKVLS